MDAFISRKRKHESVEQAAKIDIPTPVAPLSSSQEDSTEVKLGLLASICQDYSTEVLLETLLACEGSVERAIETIQGPPMHDTSPQKKRSAPVVGYQSALGFKTSGHGDAMPAKKPLTQKNKTLHLFTPEDIAAHTPCSIIHNFLPSEQADALLRELLPEAPTFGRGSFKLFENVVTSPHTYCFYVDDEDEVTRQRNDYVYNGMTMDDVRRSLPEMRKVGALVQVAVNAEIQKRIRTHYPGGKKLPYQSPREWRPNTSFVNCYDGAKENVGWHSDQLTYLGPRAVIGSISLGVAREFRVRRVVARPQTKPDRSDSRARKVDDERADAEGQISIHLPHNSLLVMHAEMQEEWKHSIAPAQAIDPHPVAGNKRFNITYRCYRESLHPKFTPKCKCGVATVLRCMQKRENSRGRYVWMCHTNYNPDQDGCSFFQYAEFDDDGEPPWAHRASEVFGAKSDDDYTAKE